jgi:hypothetical protein
MTPFARLHGMRLVFFLLLFANVVLFAWSQLRTSDPGPASRDIARPELDPQKIRIAMTPVVLAQGAAGVETTSKPLLAAASRAAPVCLEWEGIALQDLERSQRVLQNFEAAYQVAGDGRPASAYWVHIPGLKSSAALDARVAQLRAAGERDFAVARGAAPGSYYISLGVFKSEQGAQRQYERFRPLGAVVTPQGAERTVYAIRSTVAGIAEKITAAASDFQGTSVRAVPCAQARAEQNHRQRAHVPPSTS